MENNYGKNKTSSKTILTRGPVLQSKILKTMANISAAVGATLGPGGLPVIIERNETGLPNIITKDGVTVFRSLGFYDAIEHCIMEMAREGAIRTASEAGDGTTSATVLSEAIVRNLSNYCNKNPKVSAQKVTRILEKTFKYEIEPFLRQLSRKVNFSDTKDRKLLQSVAKVSANGDSDLAEAVIKCFELVGDEGNVTITEQNGPSNYEVEKIKGYPIFMGFEESCARYYPLFINDPNQQRVYLEKPIFILYHGVISEMQTIIGLLQTIGSAWQSTNFNHNVILVATGFSENVIGNLAGNFLRSDTINVFPLLVPKSPIHNGQLQFLEDLAAIAGTFVFNPITRPLDNAVLEDFGTGVEYFEASRFRSNVVGHASEEILIERVKVLQANLGNEESLLERSILEERIAKLTGGIAKLKVIGSSSGELREKKDRAEDAVCAVRGAIKHGCMAGGGWALMATVDYLSKRDDILDIFKEILLPSLMTPVNLLLSNAGLDSEEKKHVIDTINQYFAKGYTDPVTYDILEMHHVSAFESGILDSTPAVIEALRTSISIAINLGTLGGAVAFPRDLDADRARAQELSYSEQVAQEGDTMAQNLRME